jgi:hypothetical protein
MQWFLILALLLVIFVWGGKKEGFVWSRDSLQKFLDVQKTINPRIRFDLNQLQNQASEEEVRAFFRHGKWPWSRDLQRKYILEALDNTMVNQEPNFAMQRARTIYNENAMRQVFGWLDFTKQ